MHSDIQIRGSVSIVVDAIDIEQAQIESPAILKESPSIKAILAARQKESFKSFKSVCERSYHTVEYEGHQPMTLGRVEVTFTVRAQTKEEIENG